MTDFERRQMKLAMKESCRIFEEGRQEHQKGASSSQPSNARIKRGPTCSFSVREGASIPPKRIDPYMFPSKTYYQSMIDTIAEAGSGIKGLTGYQIGNTYLEEEVQELEIKETLDQAKMIKGFIYNSLKVVNLMKVFTKDEDLLRPRIDRFSTKFISLESLIRYEADLKRMCTTNEWNEFNKDKSRKSLRDKVSNLILIDRFFKKVGEVQTIMEPLVKVLKLVDQDKKPTLSIIYEAMAKTKLVIKASVKQWEKYWEVIDRR
uniref:DUF659 domain-containing protein n=1 Tax=Vitis vinifera TaxID=29760 RepID=A5BF90_VITVI|nr:hypothetical protein VITISV_007961 [Vitis vinifera]